MRPIASLLVLLALAPFAGAQLPSLDGASLFIEQFGTVTAVSRVDGDDGSGFARSYEYGFHYVWNMTVTLAEVDGVYHARGPAWVSVQGNETEVYEGYDESERECSVEFIDEWGQDIKLFVDGSTIHYAHDIDLPQGVGTCDDGDGWTETELAFQAMDAVEGALAGELPYDAALKLGLIDSFEDWGHSAEDNAGTMYYEGYGQAPAKLGRQEIDLSRSYGLDDYLDGPASFPCAGFYADELQGNRESGSCDVDAKTTLDIQPAGARPAVERAERASAEQGVAAGTEDTPGFAVLAVLVALAAVALARRRV